MADTTPVSHSDHEADTVTDLMNSVISSMDSPIYDNEVEYIINKNGPLSDDPKLCPRAVNLERSPEISLDDSSIQRSKGDTRIDEVDPELTEEGFCNISPGEYFSESCPLHFRADDFLSRESEESFEAVDVRSRPPGNPDSYDDDCVDEAIIKLKRELLEEDSEDEFEEPSIQEQSVLIQDQQKSPKKISDQDRQNILTTLIEGVERKVIERQKEKQTPQINCPTAADQGRECAVETPGKVEDKPNTSEEHPYSTPVEKPTVEDAERYLDEGTSHIRESLLSVLEALKYVFLSGLSNDLDTPRSAEIADTPVNNDNRVENAGCQDQCTQTCSRLGMIGEEKVDADLLIAGLQEEFQRCLWIHQKLTEDAHQLGFDQGIQNSLFLQDLIDQAIQMIWSLREERRQLEKYMKDKERDWNAMSRAFTQEVVDLRRENVQLLTAVANKDGGHSSRRLKSQHLKSLLKSKHDLEKAFCLNVEKQDKINELKLLVLKQQKCIRSLQERLIEEQTTNLVSKRQMGHDPDRDTSPDVNQVEPSTEQDRHIEKSDQGSSATDADKTENGSSSGQGSAEQPFRQSECTVGQGASGSPTCGWMRVEDMAKLQDVLYCDHANFALDQSRNPEIAAMQVYGIGGEDLSRAVTNPSPEFNVLDLKYKCESADTAEDPGTFGLESLEISKPESSKLASGDTL
ncbi:uncharacterized protein LOC135468939 [Liolophura sinensis]|uniref:uncharacterized protein LOC135468939 n=1 Tax=Liolophura sinensis TaxID=3198878 RepID=UPI0031588247